MSMFADLQKKGSSHKKKALLHSATSGQKPQSEPLTLVLDFSTSMKWKVILVFSSNVQYKLWV